MKSSTIDLASCAARCIVISPHLDDAALSCGGLISELSRQIPVEVWTIFCGAPLWGPYSSVAQWLHGVCGGKTGARLMATRRMEDRHAMRLLGAQSWTHFRWYDSVYRKTFWNQFLYADCRQTHWHSADDKWVRTIGAQLNHRLKPDDILIGPASIGKHVDHLITTAACKSLNCNRIFWYAEVPYLQRFPDEFLEFSANMTQVNASISLESVASWKQSVAMYSSQLQMLSEPCGDIFDLINGYAAQAQCRLFRAN